MKNVSTSKDIISTFNLKSKPKFFESVRNQESDYILSAMCYNEEVMLGDLSSKEVLDNLRTESLIELYSSDIQPATKDNTDGYYTTNIAAIKVIDVVNSLIKDTSLDNYSKLEVTKIKLSNDSSTLMIGCTLHPKELTETNNAQTYLISFFISGDVNQSLLHGFPIFDRAPIVTELLASNDINNIQKVSSITCSNAAGVVSVILGDTIHISLRLKPVDAERGDTDSWYEYVKELQNIANVVNGEGRRTLYSSVSGSGNRIAIGNRDIRNKVKNNSLIATTGNITFLVYNYNKEIWEIEDTFFERNLNIIGLGEHVSLNHNGDKLITTAIYYDDKNNIKNVIYVLAKNGSGKWTRFLREVVDRNITDLQLSNDGNKALVYTNHVLTDGVTSKGIRFFFRNKKDMVYVDLVDEYGNLIYGDDSKTLVYASNAVINFNTLSGFVVVEDIPLENQTNDVELPTTYRVIKNNIRFID